MTLEPEQRVYIEPMTAFDRPTMLRAVPEASGLPASLRVELVGARAMSGQQPAWTSLINQALEPNVFLDPAFLLPLLQHVRFDVRPSFLLAWSGTGLETDTLVGLLPVLVASGRKRMARGFRHQQVTLGTPILDRRQAADTLAALLAYMGDHFKTAFVLTDIPLGGPFHDLLCAQASHDGRLVTLLERRERAVLTHGLAEQSQDMVSIASAKRRKELRRQRRRLAELGNLTYRSAREPEAIKRAAEKFMALEASGWKGRRGSALLASPALTTFTRTMTRLMGYESRCRIDSLELDGVPVAMGILIMAGTRAHFWKTTFNQAFASFSPGVQFALDLTQVQAGEPDLTLTDSCAVPDHPMIDRIWAGRMAMGDLLIELRPAGAAATSERARALARALQREQLRRRLRQTAKTLLKAVAKAALQWRKRKAREAASADSRISNGTPY